MTSQRAIFLFTKDRPFSLKKSLNSLKYPKAEIHIIDDSFLIKNQQENYNIGRSFDNVTYWGKKEFKNFLITHNPDIVNIPFQIEELGKQEWNLGNARNSALLIAKLNSIEKVIYMDDDILVSSPTLIQDSFAFLDKYLFVGAKITGMSDHSIIGHISESINIVDHTERMLSGGFLAFKPKEIYSPFTNIYNEDWIWILTQLNDNEYYEFGEVLQAKSDPYDNYKNRVMFQEFGEIIVHGLFEARKKSNFNLLTQDSFWDKVIEIRKDYLKKLSGRIKDNDLFKDILMWLELNYAFFEDTNYREFFESYFIQKQQFNKLIKRCD